MLSLTLAFITSLAVGYAHGGVQTCNAGAPDFQQCVRFALQQLIPHIAAGVPTIGAAGVEPLQGLPPVVHSSHGLNVQLDNVVISGLSGVVIRDAHVDLASNTIRIQSGVDQISATGVQTTNAEIMGIPLKGSGAFKLDVAQPVVDLTLSGTPRLGPDGHTYLQLNTVEARIQIGGASIDVDGFFNHFPPLAHAASAFANSVAAPVIADLRPTLENWLSSIVLERAQSVFNTVSYDSIFPGRTPAAAGLYRAIPALHLGLLSHK